MVLAPPVPIKVTDTAEGRDPGQRVDAGMSATGPVHASLATVAAGDVHRRGLRRPRQVHPHHGGVDRVERGLRVRVARGGLADGHPRDAEPGVIPGRDVDEHTAALAGEGRRLRRGAVEARGGAVLLGRDRLQHRRLDGVVVTDRLPDLRPLRRQEARRRGVDHIDAGSTWLMACPEDLIVSRRTIPRLHLAQGGLLVGQRQAVGAQEGEPHARHCREVQSRDRERPVACAPREGAPVEKQVLRAGVRGLPSADARHAILDADPVRPRRPGRDRPELANVEVLERVGAQVRHRQRRHRGQLRVVADLELDGALLPGAGDRRAVDPLFS